MRLFLYSLVFPFIFGSAYGQLEVRYIEGAPKDRFQFTAACDLPSGALSLDLSTSAGKLIFDVTADGAGVEVFQPLEIVAGQEWVKEVPKVRDGDQQLSLVLSPMPQGATIAFTIDVDDTLGGREITVSGSEIEGALVSWSTTSGQSDASFGTNAQVALNLTICEG